MNRRSVEPVSALASAGGLKQQGKWGSACAVCATAKVREETHQLTRQTTYIVTLHPSLFGARLQRPGT